MTASRSNALATFLVDASGRVATWNDACQQLLGYTEQHILHQPLARLLAPPVPPASAELLSHLPPAAATAEVALARADGSRLEVRLTLLPQSCGARGSGYVVLIPPPPDSDQAEREMVANLPLKSLMSLGSNNFCITNDRGQMVLWNKRVEETTQYSSEELARAHATDMFNDHERPMVADKIEQVMHQDAEIQVEANLVSKDKRETPYLFWATRFKCHNKYYMFCMGMDISQRRQSEQILRLRERALHATSNGIVITRCAGRDNPIEYVNPAFEQISGYRADEAVGRDSRFMAAPGLDEAERALLRNAIAERRELHVVFRNMRKNGELFWNDLTITPVGDEHGTVTHFIGVLNDVTALKQRTSHLEHEVNHDPLTGLANRNLLWDRLEQAVHMAQRNKALVATVLLDLNKFKQINDTMGHEAGDEVLKVVAKRLQAAVRDSDTVARLSGDEFVLVLANQPSLRFTLRMIDRLRTSMAKPVMFDNKDIAVGASMGVSVYPHDGSSAFDLVRAADVAMYHAKAAGGKDVHFFSEAMKSTTEAKQKMEADLRNGIEHGELFLMYQPKLCLKSGRIAGIEALLRWRHPEMGVLMPASFIADAEENGLIIPLGQWVLEQVCATMQRLKLLGHTQLPVSMNASYREFVQEDFIARIDEHLRQYQLAPENFELDVREEHLMRNPHLGWELATESKQLGIRLAIDDFGAGESNLGYLQRIPLHYLKMTRSSVREICPETHTGALAKTIIDIGHNLNLGVIGEGVETRLQRDFLYEHGCDQLQGNFFSVPVSQGALEELLTAH